MPVCVQPFDRQKEMEGGDGEEESRPQVRRLLRKNLFGTVTTEQDRQQVAEQLQEITEEGARRLAKYEILGVERVIDKPERVTPPADNQAPPPVLEEQPAGQENQQENV